MRRFATALAVVTCLAAPGLAHAVDLKARAVQGVGYSHPGGDFASFAKVAARGGRAGKSTVRFYLSKDRLRNRGDVRLGSDKVPALRAGHGFSAAARAHVPLSVKTRLYYVLACADDLHRIRESNERNNCAASLVRVDVTSRPVTSRDLIESAVTGATLTAELGFLYRVYAAFGDKRLPAQYRGDDLSVEDDSVLQDVQAEWAELSPGTQALLEPFFRPPADLESWYEQRRTGSAARAPSRLNRTQAVEPGCDSNQLDNPNWTSIPAADGKVRIWRWKTDAIDQQVALSLQRWINVAYPRFKALLGREPLPDEGVLCFNGPDGALDIYLVSSIHNPKDGFLDVTLGLTTPYPPWCSGVPAFITMQGYGGPPYFSLEILATKFILAHELFHAFQYSYPYSAPCESYSWFDEGAANWAANYAFPADDTEHKWDWLLKCPDGQLNGTSYDTWVFDLYLEKVLGQATIPAIYGAFATHPAVEGVNSALSGGFADKWPEFTRYGWNQEPLTPSFAQWDALAKTPERCYEGPLTSTPLDLAGAHVKTADLPISIGSVKKLSTLGRHYELAAVSDPDIRYLKFKNTLHGRVGAAVQAIVTFADGHQDVQDWTGRDKVEFCFDDSAGDGDDVTGLVVMYSNSNWTEVNDTAGTHALTLSEQPSLQYRDACETFQYEILSANWSAHAELTPGIDICQQFAGITSSGSSDLSGTTEHVTQPVPLASQLNKRRIGGVDSVDGRISADTTWIYDITRHGCLFDLATQTFVPCDRHDHQTTTPAAFDIFSVYLQPWAADLNGMWSVPSPEVGFSSGDDGGDNPNCIVPNDSFVWEDAETDQQQPRTRFTSAGPQTISFSGSKIFSRTEFDGSTTTMNYNWTFTITFRRVDENGNPL